jgi:hypothetical protein
MPDHRALHPMPPAERQAYLDAHDLTEELLPRGQTGGERSAALAPQEKAMPPNTLPSDAVVPAQPIPAFPLIPPTVAKVCAAIAGLLGLVGAGVMTLTTLPAWVAFAVFVVAGLCGFLGGAALPSFFPNRPLVSAAVAAKLTLVGAALAAFVPHLPTSPVWLRGLVSLVVVILFGLAGKAAPQMIVAAPETPPQS